MMHYIISTIFLLFFTDFIFQAHYVVHFEDEERPEIHGSSLSVSKNIPAKWESQRIWNPGSPCFRSFSLWALTCSLEDKDSP